MNNFEENIQDSLRFKIFADVPPIPDNEHLDKFKEAGFTHYVMTEDYIDIMDESGKVSAEYLNAVKLAKSKGLKVLIRTMHENNPHYYDNITTEFQGLADGFYMCDEPSYVDLNWSYESPKIEDLASFVEWFNRYGGNTFFHVNLLQSYGIEMLHGKDVSYGEYLDKYINLILSNVKGKKTLATDYYPLATKNGENYIKEKHLFDFFNIALRVKKLKEGGHQVSAGFCIQAFSDKGLMLRPLSSERDVSFQTYVAAAFGAKHFEYFLYTWNGDGLVTDRKTQTNYSPAYYWARSVNIEMQKLASVILKYDWVEGKLYCGNNVRDDAISINNSIQGLQSESISGFDISSDESVFISRFNNGVNDAYMIVNYTEPSANVTCKTKITIKGLQDKFNAFVNGEYCELFAKNGTFELLLSSGKAAFIELIKTKRA